jgi:methionyl-tRNA formyltransferase
MTNRVLVFTDRHIWCDLAVSLIEGYFPNSTEIFRGNKGDSLSDTYFDSQYKVTISFLSPFIIPSSILDRSKLSVNFHPGTREYPGIGCFNFALYEGANLYGSVCHHVKEKVDTGKIIEEETFPCFDWDTVESLQLRSYVALITFLESFLQRFQNGDDFEDANIDWSRKPFTRRQLNELADLSSNLDEAEFQKRLRATNYPTFPSQVDVHGQKFAFDHQTREPLAFSF